MKTSKVLIIWFLIGMSAWTIGTVGDTLSDQKDKIESYERELIRTSEENFELDEQNAYLRKTIESMQMYIDMNVNPQLYTLDVESDGSGEIE